MQGTCTIFKAAQKVLFIKKLLLNIEIFGKQIEHFTIYMAKCVHTRVNGGTLGDGIGFHMPFIFAGHSVGGRAEKLLPRSDAVRRCIERQQHICIRPFLF